MQLTLNTNITVMTYHSDD